MDIVFSQISSKKHIFSIKNGEETLFSSNDLDFPFVGEYGEYETRELSLVAFKKFAFLNPDFVKLSEIEEEQKGAIKSRVIDQFNRKAVAFIRLIDNLESFDDRSKLQERVNLLKDQFDQFTKSVTETVHEFESDTGDGSQIEEQDIQEIGFEEVKDPFARDLIKLKKRIRKFYRKLHRKFGDYLKANCSSFLTRLASLDANFKRDVLVEFGEGITGSVALANTKIDSLEIDGDNGVIHFSSNQGEFVVKFNSQLLMTEVTPLSGLINSHPYMSQKFYNDLWFPVFSSVGNYMFDNNHIIVPDQPVNVRIGYSNGKYLKNKFVGFDIRDNSQVFASVYIVGANSPLQKTCKISLSENNREKEIMTGIENSKNDILKAQMVTCNGTGTKYDGISGTIHPDQKVDRNGYFEIPVTFKFDTGAEETVMLPSYSLSRYA